MKLFLTILCILFSFDALACDCAAPTHETDATFFDAAYVAGRFTVQNMTQADWSEAGGAVIEVTLKAEALYKGDVEKFGADSIIVQHDLANGCARIIEKGETYNLTLLMENEHLKIAGQCHELSQAKWDNLKAGEIVSGSSEIKNIFQSFDYKKFEIDYATFMTWYEDENTIILDLRRRDIYDHSHIKGAVHLGSDIDEKRLTEIVPNKDTRIIAYCSNSLMATRMLSLTHTSLPQLHALGYKNAYMLGAVWQNVHWKTGDSMMDIGDYLPMTTAD